jgi:hypothetical protein
MVGSAIVRAIGPLKPAAVQLITILCATRMLTFAGVQYTGEGVGTMMTIPPPFGVLVGVAVGGSVGIGVGLAPDPGAEGLPPPHPDRENASAIANATCTPDVRAFTARSNSRKSRRLTS